MTATDAQIVLDALASVGLGGAVLLIVALRLPELTREVLSFFIRSIINDLRKPPKPPRNRTKTS